VGMARIVDFENIMEYILVDNITREKDEVYATKVYSVSPAFIITAGTIVAIPDCPDGVIYSGIVIRRQYHDAKEEMKKLGYLEDKKNIGIDDVVNAMLRYTWDLVKKKLQDKVILRHGWISVDGWKPEDVIEYL